MDIEDWPDCKVEGCDNKSCLALESHYCWPHTVDGPGQLIRDNANKEHINEKPNHTNQNRAINPQGLVSSQGLYAIV